MTEDQVRAILLEWSEYEDEIKTTDKFEGHYDRLYIKATLKNGDRITGNFDQLSMSCGMLRMCDRYNLEDMDAKWFLIPIEEIIYIESPFALPYTGTFDYQFDLLKKQKAESQCETSKQN